MSREQLGTLQWRRVRKLVERAHAASSRYWSGVMPGDTAYRCASGARLQQRWADRQSARRYHGADLTEE